MMPQFASLCICTAILSLAQAAGNTCPTETCSKTLSGSDMSSPCNPNEYPNSVSCKWSFATYSSNYTQIVFSSFNVEAWHDYVKIDGTKNFIIFYNTTENQVIIIGYPSGNISANFVTDSDTSYNGFSASVSAISENNLLDQYTDYRASNSVQVLNSPMYLSSTQPPKGVSLDVMFINIPNTTFSPVEVWKEYADLISSPTGIGITDITATGFTANWTEVDGAENYTLVVIDVNGNELQRKENLKTTKLSVVSLPSGSTFNLTLIIINKIGNMWRLTGEARTDVASVVNAKATKYTQTSFWLQWDEIKGASHYLVNITAYNFNNALKPKSSPVQVDGLEPGAEYRVEVSAVFRAGASEAFSLNIKTIPGNVTFNVLNVASTSVILQWSSVQGADNYTVAVLEDDETPKTYQYSLSNPTINDLKPGRTYTITVTAVNGAGESSPAAEEITTSLDSPSDVFIDGTTKNQFELHWKKTTGATSYEYSCTTTDATNKTVPGGTNSVIISDLEPSTTYTCTVLAKTADANSAAVSVSATTGLKFCNPCINGGTCEETTETCICEPAYTGTTCEHVVDWCEAKTCAPTNSTCTNDVSNLIAVCTCNPGYTGDPEISCIEYCPEGMGIGQNNNTYLFNFTLVDTTVYSVQQCTENGKSRSEASAVCQSRSSSEGGSTSEFVDVFAVSCKLVIANVTIKIDKDSNVTIAELEKQSAQLQVLTSGDKVAEGDVQKVAQYMEDVAKIAEKNKTVVTEKILAGMVSTADNLIASESIEITTNTQTVTTQAPGPTKNPEETPLQREKKIKQKILKSLTSLAEQVVLPNGTNEIVIETPNMVVKVVNKEVESSELPDAISFAPTFVTDKTRDENATVPSTPLSITIPGSAINKAKDGGNNVKISFFLHKDASLFPSDKYNPTMIISASLGQNLTLQTLKDDITFRYNDMKAEPGISDTTSKFYKSLKSHECVFWDFKIAEWSGKGCCLDPYALSECRCDHLTNFALVVTDRNVPADPALDVVSDVGLGLSMIGLALTIIIHCLKEDVRKRRPTQILMNICGNLFFSYFVFVLGISYTPNKIACTAIAAILQFLFLASWCWMTVYSYDMYRSLVLVFNTSKSRYMTKCAIFGYGVPLLIAMLNVAVAVGYIDANNKQPLGVCDNEAGYEHLVDKIPINSSYVAGNMCWIHGFSLYIGFLLPVGLMLIFNMFVYAMVMKTLLQRGKVVKSSAKQMGSKDNILISITLTASTGLTWIIGYLMLLSHDATYLLVMSWIFAIFNTLQGVVIFLMTCVRHENMRNIWLEPILQCFSHTGTRIRMLSPRSNEFNIQSMPDTGASSFFSTTGNETTKTTMSVTSISAKKIESESIL